MSSKDKKSPSKEKKKPNTYSGAKTDDIPVSQDILNSFKELLNSIKRNKSFSFIVFSVLLVFFLIIYFQIKYDQQQRFSPDSLKENQDVYINYLSVNNQYLG